MLSVDSGDAVRVEKILEHARRVLLQDELVDVARVVTAAVRELADCDRAYCLFYDAEDDSLWSEDPARRDAEVRSGLVAVAARENCGIDVACAVHHPAYSAEADDPAGDGQEHLLVQPIANPHGQVHAVVVAVRRGRRPPFGEVERKALAEFAEHAGYAFHQLALRLEARATLASGEQDRLYRREALEARQRQREDGDVVRVMPGWVSWAYKSMIALLIGAAIFVVVGEISQYSSGPAVIQIAGGKSVVTAPGGGTVVSVEVGQGDRVEEGQLLVRLYDSDAAAELARSEREFEIGLVAVMRNPADQAARRAVAALAVDRQRAKARVEERSIRAPMSGVVTDLRARSGQHLAPGDALLSLHAPNTELKVVALLPGGDRPQLEPGMPLRLELSGYEYAYQELTIERVGSEVIGPTEARRFLGPQLADAIPLSGPVVVVEATLSSPTFVFDDEEFRFHDGMSGTAEVELDSDSILFRLGPALKGIL